MKNSELRNLAVEELKAQVAAEKEALSRLEFAHAISPIENPLRIRQSRRLVARMHTIIAEKSN